MKTDQTEWPAKADMSLLKPSLKYMYMLAVS